MRKKYENGIYEGDLDIYEIRNGYGKMTYEDGGVYEGEWKDDDFNGMGKYIWPSGSVYEGDFLDGVRSGYGKMVCDSGNAYEGD